MLTSVTSHAAGWSPDDQHLLAAALTLHTCDWAQTKEIARNQIRYYESNPLLGESPSISRVNNYFAGTAIATALAAHWMPKYRLRDPDWRARYRSKRGRAKPECRCVDQVLKDVRRNALCKLAAALH